MTDQLSKVFSALADPTRRDMVARLCVGDATVGENTNLGAGTVFVNYDGVNKNPTNVGKNAFIGSGSMLVAPLEIGEGARTGAGSVVTKDVPPNTLVVGMPARAIKRLDEEEKEEG